MTNHITQEERGRIVARAKQLVTERGEEVAIISDILISEFGISRDRARSAAAKAIRVLRGEAIRRSGPPLGSRNAAKLDDQKLERVTIRLLPAQLDKLKAVAVEKGTTYNDLIREWINTL